MYQITLLGDRGKCEELAECQESKLSCDSEKCGCILVFRLTVSQLLTYLVPVSQPVVTGSVCHCQYVSSKRRQLGFIFSH